MFYAHILRQGILPFLLQISLPVGLDNFLEEATKQSVLDHFVHEDFGAAEWAFLEQCHALHAAVVLLQADQHRLLQLSVELLVADHAGCLSHFLQGPHEQTGSFAIHPTYITNRRGYKSYQFRSRILGKMGKLIT